jgi:predicted hotdog family 3-hydroxylacyl-ACP dehydratase
MTHAVHDPLMQLPIVKEHLRGLLPHAGDMCLLDSVDAWDQMYIRCSTLTHRDTHHPLRYVFDTGGRLAAVHMLEYAAQAMAIHGTLRAHLDRKTALQEQSSALPPLTAQPGRIGVLRDVKFHIATLDDLQDALIVEGHRRLGNVDGLIYEFTVKHREQKLCEGRVIIALSPVPEAAS